MSVGGPDCLENIALSRTESEETGKRTSANRAKKKRVKSAAREADGASPKRARKTAKKSTKKQAAAKPRGATDPDVHDAESHTAKPMSMTKAVAKKATTKKTASKTAAKKAATKKSAATASQPTAKKTAKKTTASKQRAAKHAPARDAIADAKPAKSSKRTQRKRAADAPPKPDGFAALGLPDAILQTLARVGFETPTDIQRELIPHALEGRDCLGQARTGTGKTAAFTLPLLAGIDHGAGLQALVVVPTRELAAQVGEHVKLLSPRPAPKTLIVYGGTRLRSNISALQRGDIDILVGTPGRILDLSQRRVLNMKDVRLAVLDEVDRMLDIGFRDDIRRIMKLVPQQRQTIFVSATITDEIRGLARALMRDPLEINVSADRLTVDEITQAYVTVDAREKLDVLRRYLDYADPQLAIVFTRTKRSADRVANKLKQSNIPAVEIHGDLAQGRRTRVVENLRKGHVKVLVATDLAARGLDVTGVTHIVNYDIPEDPSVYVHRIGRTARMGKVGHALTMVTSEQGRELTSIEMLINREVPQVDAADFKSTPTAERVPEEPESRKSNTLFESRHAPAAERADAGEERAAAAPTRTADENTDDDTKKPRRTLGSRFPRVRGRRRFR